MQNPAKVQNCAALLAQALERAPGGPSLLGALQSRGIALILGTGLGGVADAVCEPVKVPFGELPGFPLSTVQSHAGRFVAGYLHGLPVLIQQGRNHLYEGYSPAMVVFGVRVMGLLGLRTLIVTNAAGALNPLFEAGEVMLMSDQINWTGASPLTGPDDGVFGPRFPDMSAAYDRELRAMARRAALRAGLRLQEGVYLGVTGPQLETPAETRAFRLLGADAVGMSTVLEVIAARQMGMRVLGFSCLSNKNLPDCMAEAPLDAILSVAAEAGKTLARLLETLAPDLLREAPAR